MAHGCHPALTAGWAKSQSVDDLAREHLLDDRRGNWDRIADAQ